MPRRHRPGAVRDPQGLSAAARDGSDQPRRGAPAAAPGTGPPRPAAALGTAPAPPAALPQSRRCRGRSCSGTGLAARAPGAASCPCGSRRQRRGRRQVRPGQRVSGRDSPHPLFLRGGPGPAIAFQGSQGCLTVPGGPGTPPRIFIFSISCCSQDEPWGSLECVRLAVSWTQSWTLLPWYEGNPGGTGAGGQAGEHGSGAAARCPAAAQPGLQTLCPILPGASAAASRARVPAGHQQEPSGGGKCSAVLVARSPWGESLVQHSCFPKASVVFSWCLLPRKAPFVRPQPKCSRALASALALCTGYPGQGAAARGSGTAVAPSTAQRTGHASALTWSEGYNSPRIELMRFLQHQVPALGTRTGLRQSNFVFQKCLALLDFSDARASKRSRVPASSSSSEEWHWSCTQTVSTQHVAPLPPGSCSVELESLESKEEAGDSRQESALRLEQHLPVPTDARSQPRSSSLAEILDYLRKYPTIYSAEQCRAYEAAFSTDYAEYCCLHARIRNVSRRVIWLGAKMKMLRQGTEERKARGGPGARCSYAPVLLICHFWVADLSQLSPGEAALRIPPPEAVSHQKPDSTV
ncbi:RNA polymerase II elongation factor ELL3 [Cuculus canorus]|uniref:RNA polymerase II elongation factor ELL3 n=1 Tax=Cuculus canorus TaxID=55661 RepID=UPI0023AA9AB4|nr:RNA polymerase II elongation factor ELL3 [Cuculus canorus]